MYFIVGISPCNPMTLEA